MDDVEANREWARRLERRQRVDYFRRLAQRERQGEFYLPRVPWTPWPDTESYMSKVRARSVRRA